MDTFAALAAPVRRQIVELLAADGVLAANEICRHFTISGPAVSQHLKILQDAKLVTVDKIAQRRMYRINKEKIVELERWTQTLTAEWDQKFSALDAILNTQPIKKDKE